MNEMASLVFQVNGFFLVSCVYALTHTAHSGILRVSTIVNVQSVAGTVCDVRLHSCTPYVVQHNGATALTKVSKSVRSRSSTQEAKLPAHNLQEHEVQYSNHRKSLQVSTS